MRAICVAELGRVHLETQGFQEGSSRLLRAQTQVPVASCVPRPQACHVAAVELHESRARWSKTRPFSSPEVTRTPTAAAAKTSAASITLRILAEALASDIKLQPGCEHGLAFSKHGESENTALASLQSCWIPAMTHLSQLWLCKAERRAPVHTEAQGAVLETPLQIRVCVPMDKAHLHVAVARALAQGSTAPPSNRCRRGNAL